MAMTYRVKIGTFELDPYLTDCVIGDNKLWKDAGRVINGDLKATKIGIFPKIQLELRPMTEEEAQAIVVLLRPDHLTVSYWDTESGGYKTGQYYANDFDLGFMNRQIGRYKAVKINLIPWKKKV